MGGATGEGRLKETAAELDGWGQGKGVEEDGGGVRWVGRQRKGGTGGQRRS